jgi:predicted nucleic acid-binding protein
VQILVDTTVWGDYFNGVVTPRTDYLDGLLGRAPVVGADLILTEVLQGFVDEDEMVRAHAALTRFRIFIVGGLDLALAAAANGRLLRAKGQPVNDGVDALIATFCIQRNMALLHSDPNFVPFERHLGLKVPDPGMPPVG